MASDMTPEQRALRARIAANARWGHTPPSQRSQATAAARRALADRWERDADPDGVMDPADRAVLAESLKKAHMARMTLRSSQARAARKSA